ncbi:MoaD/ThiS family protein [Novosphingobium sp. G106]|uniref:MoaD/ThiS family protein n=1 Tax=Novosphingobium sp. G106 TaxID=2849500 RepID=UPI001C2D0D10|nr:MoaD/ThiS family protein [Novosphingobium sp. G106]MBV1691160.1 MoaD/ThiS family protein [Novosphingobium sp. G106]
MARLVFLGRLEDIAGASERDVPGGALADVLAALDADLAVALGADRIRIALNGTLVADRSGVVLGEGDELAFLPPVSGG